MIDKYVTVTCWLLYKAICVLKVYCKVYLNAQAAVNEMADQGLPGKSCCLLFPETYTGEEPSINSLRNPQISVQFHHIMHDSG